MADAEDAAGFTSHQDSEERTLQCERRRQLFYEPLPTHTPHIRLLIVLEFNEDNVPICALQAYPLGLRPFTALSYTWSPPPATKLIFVNGRWRCIRANLYDFLQRGAKEKYMREPLFIDALCIDQRDIEEKEIQVQLMGDVYRQAGQVVVWLPCEAKSHRDLYVLREAIAALESAPQSMADGNQKHLSVLSALELLLPAYFVLCAFSPNPFWNRLWILQELILAQNLAIQLPSLDAVNLELFELAMRYGNLGRHPAHSGIDYTRTGFMEYSFGPYRSLFGPASLQIQPLVALAWRRKIRGNGRETLERPPLHELIASFNGQHCALQRDMIFGMLGMASTHIVADYAVPLTDLFMHVLIEGLCAIEGQPDLGNAPGGMNRLQDFYIGIMNVFGFTGFDVAAHVIVRHALRTYAPRASDTRQSGLAMFADLWTFQLFLRPHPLLERSKWLTRVVALHDGTLYLTDTLVRLVSHRLSTTGQQLWLSYMRYAVQKALVRLLARTNVELSMPDGATRTTAEWEARVQEVGSLVQQGIPPRGLGKQTNESRPAEQRRPRRQSRRRKNIILENKILGYIADQVFVLFSSLLTAWVGVQLGVWLDGVLDRTSRFMSSYGWHWPASLPRLWTLAYYIALPFLAVVGFVIGLVALVAIIVVALFVVFVLADQVQNVWHRIREGTQDRQHDRNAIGQ